MDSKCLLMTHCVQNGYLHQVCKCGILFCKVHANAFPLPMSPELEKEMLPIFDEHIWGGLTVKWDMVKIDSNCKHANYILSSSSPELEKVKFANIVSFWWEWRGPRVKWEMLKVEWSSDTVSDRLLSTGQGPCLTLESPKASGMELWKAASQQAAHTTLIVRYEQMYSEVVQSKSKWNTIHFHLAHIHYELHLHFHCCFTSHFTMDAHCRCVKKIVLVVKVDLAHHHHWQAKRLARLTLPHICSVFSLSNN